MLVPGTALQAQAEALNLNPALFASPTPYGFTGQHFEPGVGLMWIGSRWYDPVLGRWAQADTIVPNPGDPQSLNRYSYASNNPVRYVDSNGHCGPLTPVCLALLLGGMALLLQGDSPDLNVTPEDVASQRLGGALFVGGATLAAGSALAGTAGATQAGTTAACADGDCTNEVRVVGQVVQDAAKQTSPQIITLILRKNRGVPNPVLHFDN